MGCGVSKTSVTSPVSADGDAVSDPCQTPITAGNPVADEAKNQDSKEPLSVKSFSPKSLDSDAKSHTSTEEDSEAVSSAAVKDEQGHGKGEVSKSSPSEDVKKGYVAFDVPLDDNQTTTLDSVLRKPLPKRLRHLEPLGNPPQITTEKLMEKLEKAQEKRQKALARYKEKSSRRKERAMHRNEQMGDVLSSSQHPDDMLDSDQSITEKSDASKPFESADLHPNTCDENVNWNQTNLPAEPMSSPQESHDSTNQNNNNLDPRTKGFPPCVQNIPAMRQPRHGCFLQAVQEEEEGDTITEDISFSTEPSITWQEYSQRNNNCVHIRRCQKSEKTRPEGL